MHYRSVGLGGLGRPTGGTYLHRRIHLPRWRGICDFPRTWAQRAVARAVGRSVLLRVSCSVRPPRVVRQRPAFRRLGRRPSPSSSSSPARSMLITYLLIFFFLSFFVDVRRASPLPRVSKRGGFDLQSVGYTMSGGCCCCCGGPI